MTPKEKAKQLLWKYLPLIEGWTAPEKTTLELRAFRTLPLTGHLYD